MKVDRLDETQSSALPRKEKAELYLSASQYVLFNEVSRLGNLYAMSLSKKARGRGDQRTIAINLFRNKFC